MRVLIMKRVAFVSLNLIPYQNQMDVLDKKLVCSVKGLNMRKKVTHFICWKKILKSRYLKKFIHETIKTVAL